MFSHPNTCYNSEYELHKIIKEENLNKQILTTKIIDKDIKCCVLCLEDENESNLDFFDYTNNGNYILIKQCECSPTIHNDCLLFFLHISDEQICIICNKQLALIQKNIIVLMNYNLIIFKIKNMAMLIKRFIYKIITYLYNVIFVINLFIFFSLIFKVNN